MVRDRSSEEEDDEDAASPPDGRGRPGDCGVGSRLLAVVLAGVGSRRAALPLAGRWTNASTLDSNTGAARRAATFLDRLALVMAWRGVGGYRPQMTNEFEVSMIRKLNLWGSSRWRDQQGFVPKMARRKDPFRDHCHLTTTLHPS